MSKLADHTWKYHLRSSMESLLEVFYKPALKNAVRYWRTTGYFTSRSLLQVLEGIEQLVITTPDRRGHGKLRLITGVFLSQRDIDAITNGTPVEQVLSDHMVQAFPFRNAQPEEYNAEALGAELLAWLVDNGHMEIRVALPLHNGEVANDGAIFHAKEGIIEDGQGYSLAFTGSVNETPNGWSSNYEVLTTFCSWKDGDKDRIHDLEANFLCLWENRDEGARTFNLPDAVRQQLAIFKPPEERLPRRLEPYIQAPRFVPKPPLIPGTTLDIAERRRIIWSYILHVAASELPGAERVGEATSAVAPWPHQQRAFHRFWQSRPPRMLIADEVGLGKTVQAGLLLRQSWLHGWAKRILVMVPASILKQWQRELREKFALDWPIYTGKSLEWQRTSMRPNGRSQPVEGSQWANEPCVLTSSNLLRRQDRQREVLEALPWNLVVLDEAHHARAGRSTSSNGCDRRRPNNMMQLLQKLQSHTEGLLLLTATPMQVNPLEVWDLLDLLGLPPQWDETVFKQFFQWVEQENPDNSTLDTLAKLWQSTVEHFGENPSLTLPDILQHQPLQNHRKVSRALKDSDPLSRQNLSIEIRQAILALAKRWTPVQALISRHSRNLLQTYKQKGMDLAISKRNVDDRFLESSAQEKSLYSAVENFISTQYAKASSKRRSSVGFVMTIYRRRLASSVAALIATLERHLDGKLQQQIEEDAAASEDEDIGGELITDPDGLESNLQEILLSLQEERNAISTLLEKAYPLVGKDSKGDALRRALHELKEAGHRKIIIFSQYIDTVEELQKQLVEAGHRRLMAFTGKSSQFFDANGTWKSLSREDMKKRFRNEDSQILLCTDIAAEGLNFQFCGALINYDMPWNPMKVEQRIGRIDRIGQKHSIIQIINLHLEGTVETDVYKALRGRIRMFEQVVGTLQPILAKAAATAIDQAVKGSWKHQYKAREVAVAAVQEVQEVNGFDLDDVLQDLEAIEQVMNSLNPPLLSLKDLEIILKHPKLLPPGCEARKIGERDFAWSQPGLKQKLRITCDRSYYEDNSESCELWVPGSPLFPLEQAKELARGEIGDYSRQDFLKALG